MLEKTKQEIKDIKDSTINQLKVDKVDINVGLTAVDAMEISRMVVRQELAILSQDAAQTAENRLQEIAEKTIDKIQTIDNNLLQRFKDPAIQFALNETYKKYIETGDEELGENLIDLLIDRLEVDERTTKQFIIDEARQILPKLSKETLSFLTFFVFKELYIPHLITELEYKKIVIQMDKVIKNVGKITSLDTSYLIQIGCFGGGLIGIDTNLYLEKKLQENYPHIFCKGFDNNILAATIEQFNTLIYLRNEKLLGKILSYLDIDKNTKYKIKVPLHQLENVLRKNNMGDAFSFFQSLIQHQQTMKEEEIINYHKNLSPEWGTIFELFKQTYITSLKMNPVALYIGCKHLAKITKLEIPEHILFGL